MKAAARRTVNKKILIDFFSSVELFSLANPDSADKELHGIPVTQLYGVLAVWFGQNDVDWRPSQNGGLLGKAINEALSLRAGSGEKVVGPAETEVLAQQDVNIPGCTGFQKAGKLTVRRGKKGKDKAEPRDNIIQINQRKCRKGLVLNQMHVTGEGEEAVFALPFSSPTDISISAPLKRTLAYLGVQDLKKLAFNVAEITSWPETGPVKDDSGQSSQRASTSKSGVLMGRTPFVGQYETAERLEIYLQPVPEGMELTTQVQRERNGADQITRSLVISGTFGGVLCDQTISTGSGEELMGLHITRRYSDLVQSSFPASKWELSVPLGSDIDTRKECRGKKRLNSDTMLLTVKKMKVEPASKDIEDW